MSESWRVREWGSGWQTPAWGPTPSSRPGPHEQRPERQGGSDGVCRPASPTPSPQRLTLQLTFNVRKNMKWRRNYSNLSTEITGVDTCRLWKRSPSKLKYLEISLNITLCKPPFPRCPSTGLPEDCPGRPMGSCGSGLGTPLLPQLPGPRGLLRPSRGTGRPPVREPRVPGQQGSAEPHGQPARAGICHTDLCHVGWEAPARAASSALWPRRVSGMQAEPGWPQVLAGTEHRCGTPALCHTLRVGGGRPRLLPALAGSRCAGFS